MTPDLTSHDRRSRVDSSWLKSTVTRSLENFKSLELEIARSNARKKSPTLPSLGTKSPLLVHSVAKNLSRVLLSAEAERYCMTKQDVSSEDSKPQSQGWRFRNEFKVSGGESSELDLSFWEDLVGFGQAK